VFVDLGTAGGFDVDVDVGQRLTSVGQEPFEEQAVLQRVDAGDAQRVGDQRAGARTARGHPHAEVADQVAHIGHGEEVGGIPEAGDDAELDVEPLAHGCGVGHPPPDQPGFAPLPQNGVAGPTGPVELAELGEVHLADAEIGTRVERTLLSK